MCMCVCALWASRLASSRTLFCKKIVARDMCVCEHVCVCVCVLSACVCVHVCVLHVYVCVCDYVIMCM